MPPLALRKVFCARHCHELAPPVASKLVHAISSIRKPLAGKPRLFWSRYSTARLGKPVQYPWVDAVERLDMYEAGGYHPVMIDDVLAGHYRIVDKLGYGGYSTVWLAHDDRLQRFVAIKVNISNASLPQREAGIIRALSRPISDRRKSTLTSTAKLDAHDTVPSILDEFNVHGPNGTHTCHVMAPAQGNLKEASFSRLFPIHVARALAAKMAIAVDFVHSQGFVHGGMLRLLARHANAHKLIANIDIHLRNALVRLPAGFDDLSVDQFRDKFGEPETVPVRRVDGAPLPASVPPEAVLPLYLGKKAQEFTLDDARGLILSDFGEAFAPATEQRLGRDCNTPIAKRAPETLFEPDAPLSYPSDVWSLGTAIWEILGMKFIFSESETVDEVVAQQVDVLGLHNFPAAWRGTWERTTADAKEGVPRRPPGDRELWPPLEDAFEEFVQKYRKKREVLGTYGREETSAILDLMRGMLRFRPEDRLTMEQVLKSRWMVQWALPQLDEATATKEQGEY